CDVERPCTLCSRANTECVASDSSRWRPYQSTPKQAATTNSSVKNEPGTTVGSAVESAWNSSSTIKLVEEAFQQHDSASPEGVQFSALRSETWTQPKATAEDLTKNIVDTNIAERPTDIQPRQGSIRSKLSAAERELMSLLPGIGPATLLVDNYFDRIHWFILVFHQDDFRSKFQDLYDHTTFPSGPNASSRGIGFVVVLLAVFATSLHHIGAQESKLKSYNIDPEQLKSQILDSLTSRFLDIVSRGSLEAVQFSVLLASYYLYNGEPGMAWPLSGSGLRIAQALNLHRKMSPGDPSDRVLKQQIQGRKRAWWAVYEIDTSCSMLCGFPLGFSDSDCNVDPLDPYDEYSGSTKESRHPSGISLLFYKCSMSRLSAIIKSALLELYGTRHGDRKRGGNVNGLLNKVATLNGRLQEWHKKLARKLIFDGYGPMSEFQAPHDRERTRRQFENYLFRLQALSLKLALAPLRKTAPLQ
ncbi:putative transcriptional regulatory protein C3C7.04, partial [Fusarium bulbicola]